MKKYGPWLTYWVSEKDKGQADAIQKGFQKVTGEIIGWLNSDDFYLPNALIKVGEKIKGDPDLEFIVGGGIVVDGGSRFIDKYYSFPQSFESLLAIGQFFNQASSFWRRDIYYEVGGLDTGLSFCMDYDLFLRLARRKQPGSIDSLISAFRLHPESKNITIWNSVGLPETDLVRRRYGFDDWSEAEKESKRQYFAKQYHLDKRRGIIKDIISDPMHFIRQVLKKIGLRFNIRNRF
jgi:glycosyltransferase involved in cell wall biosynthesis